MFDLEQLFLAISALVLMSVLGTLIYVSPKFGTASFMLFAALWTNLRTPVAPTVTVGPFQVTLLDIVSALMLACGILRALIDRSISRRLWSLWILVSIMLFNAVRGFSHFGLQHTADEVRSWLYLLAVLVYSATAPVTDRKWWRWAGTLYVGSLVAIALVGLSGTGLGAATSRLQLDGELVDPRPLSSFGALILADGLLLLVGRRLYRRGGSLVVMAVLIASLVVLQQRTVWIATLVAGCYLIFLALRRGGRARLAATVGAALASATVAAALLTGAVQRSAVAVSAENIGQSDNTLVWRFEGWKDLLQTNISLVQSVIGEPFGSGYTRSVSGVVITVSPHSHYVETFLRFGGIGGLAFLITFVLAWRSAPAFAAHFDIDAGAARATLMALVIAGVTYRWDIAQGLLLGTIIGVAVSVSSPSVRPPSQLWEQRNQSPAHPGAASADARESPAEGSRSPAVSAGRGRI